MIHQKPSQQKPSPQFWFPFFPNVPSPNGKECSIRLLGYSPRSPVRYFFRFFDNFSLKKNRRAPHHRGNANAVDYIPPHNFLVLPLLAGVGGTRPPSTLAFRIRWCTSSNNSSWVRSKSTCGAAAVGRVHTESYPPRTRWTDAGRVVRIETQAKADGRRCWA